jgi:thymidylate kinase
MKVYSLIGPCGSGKSTLISKFPGNIKKHKESYLKKDEDTVFIDNRLNLSKIRYLNSWYLSVIDLKKQNYDRIVSDRCPYDVAAYVNDQEAQFKMVEVYMSELKENFGVENVTIYLRSEFETIKNRVSKRLPRESWRVRYHESDEFFLKKLFDYYEERKNRWDYVLENERDILEVSRDLMEIVD